MAKMSVVVFFDIGDTLAIPRQSNGSLEALPFVQDVLNKLKQISIGGKPLRLGVISNTGSETLTKMRSVLADAALLDAFDPALLLFSSVEGMNKSQKEFFILGAQRAGVPPERCVFVGESEAERKVAASAKFKTSFHPLHVFHIIDLMREEGL